MAHPLRLSLIFISLVALAAAQTCPATGNAGLITFSPGPTISPGPGGAPGAWTSAYTGTVSVLADGAIVLASISPGSTATAEITQTGNTRLLTITTLGIVYLTISNGVTTGCVEVHVIGHGGAPFVANNGFETNGLDGWTRTGPDPDAVQAVPGNGGAVAQWTIGDAYLTGTINNLNPGTRYVVSFDFAIGNTNTFSFDITVGADIVWNQGAGGGGTEFFRATTTSFYANAYTMPLIFHAVSTENRKRGPIEVGWAIDNIAIEVCSACGDPHFTGLDGIPYDYQGAGNRVIALVSDRRVQLNSRFIAEKTTNTTRLGALCFRVCNDTAIVNVNRTILVNGQLAKIKGGLIKIAPHFEIHRMGKALFGVRFGNWTVKIRSTYTHFDLVGMTRSYNNSDVHGVIGMSGRTDRQIPTDKKRCHKRMDGGCMLMGKPEDYHLALGADLCSTEWTFSQFDKKSCKKAKHD